MIKKSGKKFVVVVATVIGVFLLIVAVGQRFSIALADAQSANCCAGQSCCARPPASSEDHAGLQAAQESKPIASQIDSARISFYSVPLVCPAARQIGCGSRSKPILQELEHSHAVAAAWLNRAGTVIAVQWVEASTPAEREAAITATAKKNGLSILELRGDERETALGKFAPTVGWYNSSGVDRLSEEEADIIGARFVRRVRAAITLSDKQADELGIAVAGAIKRAWLGASSHSTEEEVLSAGREHLDAKGLAALKHAFSLGYASLPGEK